METDEEGEDWGSSKDTEEGDDFYDEDDLSSWEGYDDDDDDDDFVVRTEGKTSVTEGSKAEPSTTKTETDHVLDLFREMWLDDISDETVTKLIDQEAAHAIQLVDRYGGGHTQATDLGSALAPHLALLPYEVWFRVLDDVDVTSIVRLGLSCRKGHAIAWRYIDRVIERWNLGPNDHISVTPARVKESTRILCIQGDETAMTSPHGPRRTANVVLSRLPPRVEHLVAHNVSVRFSMQNYVCPRFAGVVCMDLRSSKRMAIRCSIGERSKDLHDCLQHFVESKHHMPRLRRMRGVTVNRAVKRRPNDDLAKTRSKMLNAKFFAIKTREWTVDRSRETIFGTDETVHYAVGPSTNRRQSLVACDTKIDNLHVIYSDDESSDSDSD